MRIVQVSPYDLARHGGVQQHVHSLAGALRQRGHEVLLIGPGGDGASGPDVVTLGRKKRISVLGTSFELSLASAAELRALKDRLEAWKPDVMHYHTMWVPMLLWQIFRQTRVPSVATFHDTPPPGAAGDVLRGLFKLLSWYLLSRLDGAIAVSPAPMGHLRPGDRGCKPRILPPSTDLSDFLSLPEKPDRVRHMVLFIGRLEPRKGIDVLLKAWRHVVARAPVLPGGFSPKLVVAGGGEMEAAVAAACEEMGKDLIAHVPSPTHAQLLSLLAEASLLVSPARFGESFGIVLVESLASGTPAIGAANKGYVNVLTGEGAELLVPAGDATALAEKITDLLSDPVRLAKLSAWGREHARQFDVAKTVSAFEQVYSDAMLHASRSKEERSGNHA